MKRGQALGYIALCVLTAAGSEVALANSAPQELRVSAADRAAVSTVSHSFISVLSKGTLGFGNFKLRSDTGTLAQRAAAASAGGGDPQYPGDLGNSGGATLASAQQHPIYLIPTRGPGSNCSGAQPATCWGNVSQFISDLATSPLIRVTDQYVGAQSNDRYPLGTVLQARYRPQRDPLTDADMQALVHAAAVLLHESGYHHLFHVFLVPGQVECFDSTFTVCSSNVFCAYHGSVVFPDVGEVVYSVEPNVVNVFGCQGPANRPNGGFDDTYSVLSHETIEAITDPDGSAWFNVTNAGLLGSEIGDECLFWLFDAQGNFISTNPVVQVFNGRPYDIQTEYNNAAHACTTQAASD
jgi:hypothetical protein